jgi:hypothetical protein
MSVAKLALQLQVFIGRDNPNQLCEHLITRCVFIMIASKNLCNLVNSQLLVLQVTISDPTAASHILNINITSFNLGTSSLLV